MTVCSINELFDLCNGVSVIFASNCLLLTI